MQLDLFSFPFPAGSWARPSRRYNCIVVWVSDSYEACKAGLAASLKGADIHYVESQMLNGGCAYLLECSAGVRSLILAQLPKPRSAGTFTPGNFLPW